jgi:cell division septal protein FtsQ
MKNRKNRYRANWNSAKESVAQWCKEICYLILAFAAILGFSAVLTRSYHGVLNSPWPLLEKIQITGLKHLERKEVLNALALPVDANVFALRMSQLSQRLKDLPWVDSAVVRLDMPGRLVVEVSEREPLAIVYANEFYLIDKGGKLFSKADVAKHPELPLFTDFSGWDLRESDVFPPYVFDALKDLLLSLDKVHQWLPLTHISECRWDQESGFTLYTIQNAIPIRIGKDDFDRKLSRLHRIFGILSDHQWWESVRGIDLDYSNKVYIKGDFPTPKGI